MNTLHTYTDERRIFENIYHTAYYPEFVIYICNVRINKN